MHIHILGICGTFMGGLAILARAMGHKVTGADANVYPPMSTQLEQQEIALIQGFEPSQLQPAPDLVVIGNAMSRGNPCVEAVLEQGLKYTSGPQFLHDYILPGRWVLAVSGTHGKTSTSSMLAWILESCGYQPGFLIGGIPRNFGVSARLGDSPFFVVEADEYDSAFFDKRSKFVHYQPRTLVINNLEYDHADIFEDLHAIQKQFQHLLRIVPGNGRVIWPQDSNAVAEVVAQGCWSEQETISHSADQGDWQVQPLAEDGHRFELHLAGQSQGVLEWSLLGKHNMENALMAVAAARHVGVKPADAIAALAAFIPPKRRLELIGNIHGVQVFDDFAHHPTAIATTLQGLRAKVGKGHITVVLEPRSNTMKSGVHKATLAGSMHDADNAVLYQAENIRWDIAAAMDHASIPVTVLYSIDDVVLKVAAEANPGDTIVIMSNGGFGGIHGKLLTALDAKFNAEAQR
ncbi:UDP-N-acetylmuramate:L-alanyl-gamma-D-glutamyl-meso-diaminopimelate ligase [Shewanella dokdonensis]|uniref:UDP-N-acetylmuramate--L-alanyl-gamma-D-glutamyl-meso-2,6-diaminoheptandioate ligase n=1 Tax=Shewanella dokdonensis TaxID=712036 RepID=A0ABX8DHZ0_9GAMM|nr:UDP-N-acetylmuramate:L-alanyl-gamma-D-glutamyl-meso-diaminopimelate ligase [Shewanella dokdonensis]MCL1074309.1 UDP-N-acetylmuramate:L-alanyl-gamma-D-glutamyl-meso-diaminopimelate ligase [Shewanella dokdonensis]QVK24005.1 UDP-N-acetylmuramate:L-alanyl-gamma-D-glutamyl-meso-diaminopimelate ligase [Shewanella dokdonensis]